MKAAESYTHTHTHTQIIVACLLCIYNVPCFCTDIVQDIKYQEQLIQELKQEIAQIDSETARCEKAKKNWKIATIVGGVGVAATGTAAIVQTVKSKKDKEQSSNTDKK